jgi:UDP-N-acetylmuramoylalanine--D-glutamate ligase
MGGADKGLEMQKLIDAIPKYCKHVLFIPGTGTERVRNNIDGEQAETLEEAIRAGLATGKPGDILLFSPAFASFGMFKNEYDRNDQFVSLVEKL